MIVPKAILREGNKILILKKTMSSKKYPGKWDLPGGKPDEGETTEETLIRETQEEIGVTVAVGAKIATFHSEKFDAPIFEAKVVGGTFELGTDHSEYKWVEVSELEELDLMPFFDCLNDKLE